jgi:SAM-dependent methyltransferase
VAASLNLDARSTALMLRACAGLGFLGQADDKFHNLPVAAVFLVSSSPAYMGNVIRYSDQLYATWGKLEDALRSGQPALPAATYLGDDPAHTRAFVVAMHERALGIARALVPLLDLSGRHSMLDVGGGPGTYSVMLTERFPGLKAEVLELPGVAAVARELVAAADAADRVSLRDGDYHSADFGSGKDVVLMSGMFHRETAATCQGLIRRAADCLDRGGLLIVSDVFTDAGGTQPAFAALFGLNMMLTAADGGVHADADVQGWMAEAGFTDLRTNALPPPMPHRVVMGVKA